MRFLFFIICSLFLIPACNNKESTDTSGKINLLCDDSFLPLVKSEAKIFLNRNKKAKIKILSVPQKEAIRQFVEDSVEMIIVSKGLSENQKAFLKQKNIEPQTFKIANEGITFVINRQRKDSSLTIEEINNILTGKFRNWKDIKREGAEIKLVIDKKGSSLSSFLSEKFNTASLKLYAAGSQEEVIEYVKKDSNAIGVIGLAWLSGDPSSNEHLKNVRVLSVEINGKYYDPCQQDIATGQYPFIRDILLINKYKTGLGTGFAFYVLSEDGQRIVLKSGLLPAIMPGREVIFEK